MWSPIALNKNEMDPSKWQSENQAAFEAGQTVDASPAAGFANATGIKAPTFYAWGLVTKAEAAVPAPAPAPTPAPAAVTCSCSCGPDCSCGPSCTCAPNAPAPASAPSLAAPAAACSCGCGPICTCTPGTDCGAQCTSTPAPAAKASPAPMGTYADFMNPGDWSSEYDNKFLSVASAGDSKSAGIVTAAVDKAGAFMEWGCRPPGSKTEYTSAFAPVINTAPVVIAKKSISVGAPYAEDTVSKGNWQSEYDSSYAIIKTMPEIVNELVNAVNEKVEPSVEMRAIDEDDFVFVELPSEPVDEAAVCAPTTNNIFMTSSKAKKMVYNSEYNDRFQWPAMVEACRIPSGLKDEMAITKFKSAKKGSMVTESQSKYSWPVASMSTRAASGKRTSKAMERNSNFMYHVETVSAPVATDTTSIDTLAPIAANDTDTLTTFKGDVIPAKPFIHSEPDLESAVTAATPAAPLTAHKTSNLVFQDSAAAYRLAKDTGLREDAFFKRRQTASPAKRLPSSLHSAPPFIHSSSFLHLSLHVLGAPAGAADTN